MAAGSAGYTPPEQAQPGSGIDARADVYSLGALGYHLVTGSVPGPPGKVVRPERLRTDLAPDVQRALLRAMEPDRERRWPTALSLAVELERLAEQVSMGAVRVPRRRRRTALVAVAAAVAIGAAGVTAALVTRRSDAPSVTVEDASGQVSVEVPDGWGRQLRDSGWNPRTVGLSDTHEPGLAVADDLAKWQNLRSGVDGVFVGLSEHGDVRGRVGAIAHTDCHYEGSRTYTGTRWHGLIRTWSACPGSHGSLTEAGLTSAGGNQQPQLYVQIRQAAGSAATTDRILGSIRAGD
jgi:hypothetical protein